MLSLTESDIHFVLCRHEQAAAFMADAALPAAAGVRAPAFIGAPPCPPSRGGARRGASTGVFAEAFIAGTGLSAAAAFMIFMARASRLIASLLAGRAIGRTRMALPAVARFGEGREALTAASTRRIARAGAGVRPPPRPRPPAGRGAAPRPRPLPPRARALALAGRPRRVAFFPMARAAHGPPTS